MKRLSVIFLVATTVGIINCAQFEFSERKRFSESELKSFNKNALNAIGDRIIGGAAAPAGAFPYQVAIWNDFGLFCGGALISKDFVLTAAHCIDRIFYLLAYLGVHNINERNENWIEWVLHRDSCQLHPQWDALTRANDIALIEFPESIQLNSVVNPIALPSRNHRNWDYANEYVTVTGWGYSSVDAGDLTPFLQSANLRVLSLGECRNFFPDRVQDTNICTDTRLGPGICHGDSGAPIILRKKNSRPTLVGLASFVQTGCAFGWPNVFTRLDRYLNWIGKVTKVPICD